MSATPCTLVVSHVSSLDASRRRKTIAIALTLVLSVAAITTWRVLSVKAAPYLRAE